MQKIEITYLSEQEYLASELVSNIKREYIDGQAYAMAGASDNHGRIAMNIASEFRNHLKGSPCEAFIADMKVGSAKAGKKDKDYFYPDVLVDCRDGSADSYLAQAPKIIIEVLSKSTKKLDFTTKLIRYINLPSLLEYVLIEQDFVSVVVFRKSNHWVPCYYFIDDAVTFDSIGLTLSVEEIYDRVDNGDMIEFRQTKAK
ncbi:MAG: Uma2 family endonuclease [Methylococcales bacterium]